MIYFITENYLKTNTPITKNVDSTDIAPYIKPSADMSLEPILGTYFYEYLLDAYNNQSLSTDEETLVEKIQPVVAWRAAEQAAFGLSYQLKNKGLQVQFGDYSTNVSQSEVAFNMEHYGQIAARYENILIKWLLKNKSLFPEFTSTQNESSIVEPVDNDDREGYNFTMMTF
jgi:hypothetical protein